MNSSEFDASTGAIYIEIPVMLSSESGDAKHTDLNEQGLFLADALARYLRDLEFEGAELSELKYWGTQIPGSGEPIRLINFKRDL